MKNPATRMRRKGPSAVRSTPANRPRRALSKSSIRCRRSAKPVRPSSRANGTKAGYAFARLMMTAGSPAPTMDRPALQQLGKVSAGPISRGSFASAISRLILPKPSSRGGSRAICSKTIQSLSRPHHRRCGTGISPDRDITARRHDVAAPRASLPTAPLAPARTPAETAASRRRMANSRERQVRT
jgi:hypothetical protein